MIGNIIYASVAFIFGAINTLVKVLAQSIKLSFYFFHKRIEFLSKKKGITVGRLYSMLCIIIIIVFSVISLGIAGFHYYSEYRREENSKQLNEARIAKEQQETEKRLALEKIIAEEKAKTPEPSITLLSPKGNQGKKIEYILKFSVTDAEVVTVNSEKIEKNGSGVYEKQMILSLGETNINIEAKNKYFSDLEGFILTRDKTDAEVREEKEAEAKALAEEREAERLEKEEQKRVENEKRQALENEKKTYTPIAYPKLAKNPSKYKGDRIRFRGKIFSADEEGTNSAFQINTDGYGIDDQIITLATWSNDYTEGDWVTVWGMVIGEQCYTSQAGWNICVPSVKANIIE